MAIMWWFQQVVIPPAALSILLFTTIGAKLICPHDGIQVEKEAVTELTGSTDNFMNSYDNKIQKDRDVFDFSHKHLIWNLVAAH